MSIWGMVLPQFSKNSHVRKVMKWGMVLISKTLTLWSHCWDVTKINADNIATWARTKWLNLGLVWCQTLTLWSHFWGVIRMVSVFVKCGLIR